MKLSTRSRYSARILVELATNTPEKPLQVKEIAKRQGISAKYIEQLIRTLKSAGWLTSRRGPSGGHILAKAPETITMGDIVRLFEGQSDLAECVHNANACPKSESCRFRLIWQEATAAMYQKLDNVSIADLICDPPDIDSMN